MNFNVDYFLFENSDINIEKLIQFKQRGPALN